MVDGFRGMVFSFVQVTAENGTLKADHPIPKLP
jgi:hypothetical protein